MIFTIIETAIISFLVGYGCYQWGYHKAIEKSEKIHQREMMELKKQHREEASKLFERINEKEQD